MPPRSRPVRRRAVEATPESAIPDLASCQSDVSNFRLARLTAALEAIDGLKKAAAESDQLTLFAYVEKRTAVNLCVLYAAALQFSGAAAPAGIDDSIRNSYRKLRATISTELSAFLVLPDVPGFTTTTSIGRSAFLAFLILRTQVISRLSLQLRMAAQNLKQRISRRNVDAVSEALTETHAMMFGILAVVRYASAPDACKTKAEALKRLLIREMEASDICDAWATCYVQILVSGEISDNDATTAMFSFQGWFIKLQELCAHCIPPSPGLLFLLSSHVVRLLALMDGGSTYGLPKIATQVPALDVTKQPLRKCQLDSDDSGLLSSALKAFCAWLDSFKRGDGSSAVISDMPHFAKAPMFDIGIRLARAAIAAWDSTSHPVDGQRGVAPVRVRWSRMESWRVLNAAIHLLMAVQRNVSGAASGRIPSSDRRWCQLLAVYLEGTSTIFDAQDVRAASVGASSSGSSGAAGEPSEDYVGPGKMFLLNNLPSWFMCASQAQDPQVLPSEPSPVVAKMLELKFLRCYERNLRRQQTGAVQISYFRTWLELVLFGPMEDLAGVITSTAKAVRELALDVARTPPAPPGVTGYFDYRDANDKVHHDVLMSLPFVWGLTGWMLEPNTLGHLLLKGGGGLGRSAPSGGDIATSGPLRQLSLVWSWRCVRLLPTETLAFRIIAASDACGLISKVANDGGSFLDFHLHVHRWCQVLLAAYLKSAEDAESDDSDTAADAAAAVEQWRDFLLEEVGLMRVLGASASLLADYEAWLPDSCVEKPGSVASGAMAFSMTLLLARWIFPDELLAVLEQGDAQCLAANAPAAPSTTGAASEASCSTAGASCERPADQIWHLLLSRAAIEAVLHPESGSHPDEKVLSTVMRAIDAPAELPLARAMTRELIPPEVWEAASLLLPPELVRRRMLIDCCANPSCLNLLGPSERSLAKLHCLDIGCCCGSFDSMWYCSTECHDRQKCRTECKWLKYSEVAGGSTEG